MRKLIALDVWLWWLKRRGVYSSVYPNSILIISQENKFCARIKSVKL